MNLFEKLQKLKEIGPLNAAAAIAVLLLVLVLIRAWRTRRRRRQPPRLHPKLRQYGGDAELQSLRHAEAQRIIATASTAEIVGYAIDRQVEAIVVGGFRRIEEAVEGLKAAAAMKGANALVNVRNDKDSHGRWTASGDAVVIKASTGQQASGAASPPPSPSPRTYRPTALPPKAAPHLPEKRTPPALPDDVPPQLEARPVDEDEDDSP